ncbi:MAG: type III pantothenate kinase [Candidatus Eisenbacteria sp.]|nr:type III pantothenate kinase [Candidatus Eisenbacteria bacterium]
MSGRSKAKGRRSLPRKQDEALLAIDVGNTQTVLGVFAGEQLISLWRMSSRLARTGDELSVLVESLCRTHLEEIRRSGRVVIGSVVPMLTQEFEAMTHRLFEARPLIVTNEVRCGVQFDLPDPTSIGADRIANAAAVAGGSLPAIVVDLGTATTFDVVNGRGHYIGGAIAPGIRTSADELFRRAARLAKVEIRKPRRRIGRTTEESIQSGIFYSAVGTIDGIVRELEAELRCSARVIATGGLAPLVAPSSRVIQEVDEALTLRGFARIDSLNR